MMNASIEFLLAGQRFRKQKLLTQQVRKRNATESASEAPEEFAT
jgi:hypothetical protein